MQKQFFGGLDMYTAQPARNFGAVTQLLDGTISGNQFIDKSGNGYNVDIINNDISIGTIGFPYKSNALISQKVANYGLIPNPNNFWYDSFGNPNQIPVVSFFQNIDYGNQIFTQHQAQVLNGNGQETTEPSVRQIVTYSSQLIGTNLTNASTYFSVPSEVTTNVIWVDWVNGSDSNPGTKALPYKTLTKANIANKTIYVKTGTYSDTATIYLAGTTTWYFIGYSTSTNTATPAFGTSASNSNYMQGAIITPPSSGKGIYFISGNNNTVYRCKIANSTSAKNFQLLAGTGNAVKYCIFNNSTNTNTIDVRAVGLDIYGCHFSGSSTLESITFNTTNISGNVNILYNKFVNTLASGKSLFLFNISGNYYIKYNTINTDGGTQLQTLLPGSSMTGIIQWQYNNINSTNLTSSCIFNQDPLNVISYNISYNYIKLINGACPNSVISLIGQNAPIIDYNYIDLNIKATAISINSSTPMSPADISYNTILTRKDGGHIVLGSDVSSAYDNGYNGSTIIGNKCYGIWYFDPTSLTNLSHGIAVFNCIDVKVKYNYCNGANHLVVYKASDRSVAVVNTDAVCSYNIGINNDVSLFAKTMAGIKFYNNTTYCSTNNISSAVAGGIYLLGSTGPAINTIIKNNIFIDATNYNTNTSLIRIDPTGSQSGLVIDNNVYYSANGNYIAKILNPASNYNFTQWQALGYDTNTLYQNVTFNSISNEQWWPTTIINNATNLGSPYNLGLDISTNWEVGTTNTPIIVTKIQPVLWQNGAYVQ